jgi:hypothetical protein
MKLDARRAFIKSSKGKLGGIVINTPAENLLPGNISERPSQILEVCNVDAERYGSGKI